MIRSAAFSISRVVLLSVGASCSLVEAAPAAGTRPGSTGSTGSMSYSAVPMHSTDHFVQGRYDKTGIYIPPHYQPVTKPPFHGYYFKKKGEKVHKRGAAYND